MTTLLRNEWIILMYIKVLTYLDLLPYDRKIPLYQINMSFNLNTANRKQLRCVYEDQRVLKTLIIFSLDKNLLSFSLE